MLVYSKTINSFLNRLKTRSREILSKEAGLVVRRSRFEWKGYLIPFHIVAFEDPKRLGYFDSRNYQIGINKNLMMKAKPEVIDNILRHEWAHFICYLTHKDQVSDHGKEYREICTHFNWGENVYKAYGNIEEDNLKAAPDETFEKVRSRIQKLLNLASSSNPHEAESATAKANELLLKHNLQFVDSNREEEVCVKKVLVAKRMNAKLNALYDIMKHFFVQPVFNRGEGMVSLDVVGSRFNVEMADYVAKFLDQEFEFYWKKAQKENPNLKGTRKKNSYFLGLAKGFDYKLKNEKLSQAKAEQGALIRVEAMLERQIKMAFPRLSKSSSSQGQVCQQSAALGAKDGMSLSIRQGVSQGNRGRLLGE